MDKKATDLETERIQKKRSTRPQLSWRDDIVGHVGISWMRIAEDRKRWRQMEEALFRSGRTQDEKEGEE